MGRTGKTFGCPHVRAAPRRIIDGDRLSVIGGRQVFEVHVNPVAPPFAVVHTHIHGQPVGRVPTRYGGEINKLRQGAALRRVGGIHAFDHGPAQAVNRHNAVIGLVCVYFDVAVENLPVIRHKGPGIVAFKAVVL